MTTKKIFQLATHVWLAGFVNIIALSLQLMQLIQAKTSEGLSVWTCVGTLYIQYTYARLGKQQKNTSLSWCMYLSFVIELAIMTYAIYLRHGV